MSDAESSDRSSENSEHTESLVPPIVPPRVSLPIRFANPQNADSERPVADISIDNLFVNQTEINRALLNTINQTLNQVDRVLENTDQSLLNNLLDQNTDMAENDNLITIERSENHHSNSQSEPLSNSGKQ